MQNIETRSKQEKLEQMLNEYKSVVVAFSSGVDSTYLLKVASEVLKDKVIAVTAASCFFPKRELEEAVNFCEENHIRHIVMESDVIEVEGVRQNPKNRCYLCKYALFEKIKGIAGEYGIEHVIEASNIDDNGDYRPGMLAINELGIKSPLREVGLTKSEIRILSKEKGLTTWKKPSFACLASRFVYGEELSEAKLHMVEKAEQLLMELGFHQMRVRIHDKLARIEIDESEFDKIMRTDIRTRIFTEFKEYGFMYVTLDLQGYRMGSMNETLTEEERKTGIAVSHI